jgi:two-component system, response regulator RegA
MQHLDPASISVLIADSDGVFRQTLARLLEQRGYVVQGASTLAEARHALTRLRGALLITDIRFPDGNGLDLLEDIARQRSAGRAPVERAIVLTSYGTVAGAVAAAKRGATDFLAKPSDADTIEAAMRGQGGASNDRVFARPDEIEFRYLLTIFEQHDRNMSETARAIGMHRRTLQRILRRRGIAPTSKAEIEQPNESRRAQRLARLWTQLLQEDTVPDLADLSTEDHEAEVLVGAGD